MHVRDLPAAILGLITGIFFLTGLAVVEGIRAISPFARRSTPSA
ncbi:hypothetical protein [Aeromicrobium endophyticum]|nr:hypothetical protein [Aeromicrobium endophyticum]